MMKVKNKWNGRIYTVKCINDVTDEVTLIRDDGSELIIAQGEFKFNYREVNK